MGDSAPVKTKSDLKQWLRDRNTNQYFVFNRRYYRIIKSKLAALFLQDVINLSCLSGTKWDEDWFQCTAGYLEPVGWSSDEQKYLFRYLTKTGLIKVKKKGIPASRWVFIDCKKIDHALAKSDAGRGVKSPALVVESSTTKKTPTESNVEKKNCRPKSRAATRPVDSRADRAGGSSMLPDPIDSPPPAKTRFRELHQYEIYARRLFDAVAASRHRIRRFNASASAKQFAMLVEEVGDDRVSLALDWLCARIDDPYTPQAWTGKSFRAKFANIEAQMKRDNIHNPDVTVTAPALAISNGLRRSGWKHGEPADLAVAVQLSLNNVIALKQKLGRPEVPGRMGPIKPGLPSPFPEIGIPKGFAAELYRKLGSPEVFVEQWFLKLSKWIGGGKLIPRHVISLDNPNFDTIVGGMAASYGDVREWNKLRKILSREVSGVEHKQVDGHLR